MQEQAHLIGAGPRARGAIGGEMGLPRLDVIFSLAARAVDVLVQGAWRSGFQVGDDEASIHAQWSGLDARDDSLDAIPACRPIVELLEPPDFLARRE